MDDDICTIRIEFKGESASMPFVACETTVRAIMLAAIEAWSGSEPPDGERLDEYKYELYDTAEIQPGQHPEIVGPDNLLYDADSVLIVK